MTSAFCRFDNDQNFLPARTLTRRGKEGAGHWLVAYREREQKKIRRLHRRIKETYSENNEHGVTLDGPLLLQLHRVDEPSQLCSVDISEQRLNSVKPDDLREFTNAAYIVASINSLSLGSFSCFVSLRELNLSLNGICNLTFDAADFPHLKVLDLSFNNIQPEDTVSLGRLPCLKILHLTGNKLRRLPLNFGSSNTHHAQLSSANGGKQFEILEVLMLDNNKLSSEVFHSLTNLSRLQHLNLQRNCISEIPHMQTRDGLKPGQLPAIQDKNEAQSESNPDCKTAFLPLPELQHLGLAENKISTEEALIAAASFPKLRELDIHSNPLITQKRGDLPLLTYYLQERLGIKIERKKVKEFKKLPLKVSTDPKWKVEENILKGTKRQFLKKAVSTKQTQSDEFKETDQKTIESDGTSSSKVHKNTKHFFITQAEDELQSELVSSAEKRAAEESMILDAKADPDVLNVPVGIQTAVRMLEHTLRNLNVYRDSKPKLDSIQTPYREREKKIKKLPPLKPVKQPHQRVDELMKEMKQSTTMKVVALDSALHSKGVNRKEYKEARSLLKDLMMKHKMIHEEVMDRAASVYSDPPPAQELD